MTEGLKLIRIIDRSLRDQVSSAHLLFYKIEFGDGDENEVNLIETALIGKPFAEKQTPEDSEAGENPAADAAPETTKDDKVRMSRNTNLCSKCFLYL